MSKKRNFVMYVMMLGAVAIILGVGTEQASDGLITSDAKQSSNNSVWLESDKSVLPKNADPLNQKMSLEQIQVLLKTTSLFDTEVPGIPQVDAQGQLIIDSKLRDIFDYFLALKGEWKDEDIRRLISNFLALHLSETVQQDALAILDRYESFNRELAAFTKETEISGNFQNMLQQQSDMRRKLLDEALADAFFGEEEAYDRYSLLKGEIYTHPGLNEDQKSERLKTAMEAIPRDLRIGNEESYQIAQLLNETKRLENAGASAAEIYQYQLLHSDVDVAERYQTLRQHRQTWWRRYDDYRSKVEAVKESNIKDTEKLARINQLQTDIFTEEERLRVQSLDRMDVAQRRVLSGG